MRTQAQRRPRTDLPTGPVTFLFTDIEGSTRLTQALGDGFAGAIDRHHDLLRSAITDAGGIVVSTEGDAFFAVFVSPLGAITAAVSAQRALARERWPEGVSVRVRMGLHSGIGRLGGDDYAGIEVNRAARIAGAGHGGQVLVSASTAQAVTAELPPGVGLRDLGAIMLKDFEDTQRVWQLEAEGLDTDFPLLRAERPGYLPEPLTSFLGRAEVERAMDLVRGRRLVTLTGPGGSGKTRISIEAARRLLPEFPGGAWFVRLETIRDRALVLPEIADTLGIGASPGQPLPTVLAGAIGDTPTLLVLDNLEQVVEAGPDLARLLEGAPGLRILASSREPLRVGGEQELPVPVLGGALAVELFVERAQQVRPGFDPTPHEREQLHRLVDRLDRLPLAIELAAARARRLSVATLCEVVPAALADLGSGRRDAADRQRTLRGAVAWSYDLLEPSERQTFDRFAVFRGGTELRLVAKVIDPGRPELTILDELEALADKSLLLIREAQAGGTRARMLETIHAFADERFEQDPGRAEVRARHAQRFLAFCEEIEPELIGARSDIALAHMESEHDNVRAALDWSLEHDPAVGLRIGGAVWRYWQQRTHLEEGQRTLEALFAATDERTDPYALGCGFTALGSVRYWQGDYEGARREYERAVEFHRADGRRAALAKALYDLSFPVAFLGDHARADALSDESLRLFEAMGDAAGMSLVKEFQVLRIAMRGDVEQAEVLQREVLAERRAEGGLFRLADNLGMQALLAAQLGRTTESRALLEEMREVQRRLLDRSTLPGGLEVQAVVAMAEGDYETTALCIGAVQGIRDRSPNVMIPGEVLGFYDPGSDAREHLGERFDTLFELGRSMDPREIFLTDGLAADLA